MDYMNSTNANNGICSLSIVFEVGTDPNMDQTLAYMRYGQATAPVSYTHLDVYKRQPLCRAHSV